MEKQKFEQEWKDAFDQAEVSPSETLWTNIELNLEKAETGKMKSMLQFYKLMAAASIIFAMGIAGAWMYYYNSTITNLNTRLAADLAPPSIGTKPNSDTGLEKSTEQIRKHADQLPHGVDQNAPEHVAAITPQTSRLSPEADQNSTSDQNRSVNSGLSESSKLKTIGRMGDTHGAKQISILLNNENNGVNNRLGGDNKTYGQEVVNLEKYSNGLKTDLQPGSEPHADLPVQLKLNERALPSLASTKKISISWPEKDPVAIMMAKLAQRERELMDEGDKKPHRHKQSDSRGEKLWTSVGFAAGSFNAVNQNSSNTAATNTFAANSVTANQSKASGTSYSLGMNVGTKLSARWVLQGGVNYLSQNSSYEANSVVGSSNQADFQAASISALSSKNSQFQDSRLVATVPYNVDNNLRFVSVPILAGYMVVNRSVGLQLNGGVSTDLFLQSTLTPQSSSLPKTTQGNGEDSPYRSVNFSGLVGTEISYRFSKRYRLALNPGLRYPLNSIYKPDAGVKATPLTFDVGLRFRYIFH